MKYQHIAQMVAAEPWAILPSKLEAILCFLASRIEGEPNPADQELARVALNGRTVQNMAVVGSTALIPVFGTILHRHSGLNAMSGGTSTQEISGQLRQSLDDPAIKAIVLDIDSPGGTVAGVNELASEIREARERKKIVAQVNSLAASAGYWIAAQASEIVSIPSGHVGSIGVFAAHQDLSKALEMEGVKHTFISAGKYKTEGNPFEPLSAEAKAAFQSRVDDAYEMFVSAVAKGRSVPPSAVRSGYGQGRTVNAVRAVEAGMVDRLGTLDDTLARLSTPNGRRMMHAEEITTVREFESHLRDVGFSANAAKNIAVNGFKASTEPRDEDGEAASILNDAIENLKSLKGVLYGPRA